MILRTVFYLKLPSAWLERQTRKPVAYYSAVSALVQPRAGERKEVLRAEGDFSPALPILLVIYFLKLF